MDCQTGEFVKIEGSVKCIGASLIAPFSGRPCVHYYTKVDYHQKRGTSGNRELGRRYTLIEEEYGTDLLITDGKGYALIEAENIKSTLKADKTYLTGTLGNPLENLRGYMEKRAKDFPFISDSNESIRYKEGIIEEDETVMVAGKMTWKRKGELKFDLPAERVLVVSPNEKEPVYLSIQPASLKSSWNFL